MPLSCSWKWTSDCSTNVPRCTKHKSCSRLLCSCAETFLMISLHFTGFTRFFLIFKISLISKSHGVILESYEAANDIFSQFLLFIIVIFGKRILRFTCADPWQFARIQFSMYKIFYLIRNWMLRKWPGGKTQIFVHSFILKDDT